MKFGGTSLADFEAMSRCAAIVNANPEVKVVVVSAIANTTRILVSLSQSDITFEKKQELLKELKQKHYQILDQIKADKATITNLEKSLKKASALTGAKKPEQIAELLSLGETMSALLFTAVLKTKKIPALNYDVRNLLITNDNWFKAEPNLKLIKSNVTEKLLPLLEDNLVVTQGFIGSNSNSKTTLLGMEGSDFTAALLAEALHASCFEIWKDVAGVFTIDPDLIPEAVPIDHLGFYEAAELAAMGARVLHPRTIQPAARSNMKFCVGSSINSGHKTWIGEKETDIAKVSSMSLRNNQVLVTVKNRDNIPMRKFLAKLFTVFEANSIDLDLVTSNSSSTALVLDDSRKDLTQESLLTSKLITELEKFCSIKIEKDLALIALIGTHMADNENLQQYLFEFFKNHNIRSLFYGVSSHSIGFLVNRAKAQTVAQMLHRNIFEEGLCK